MKVECIGNELYGREKDHLEIGKLYEVINRDYKPIILDERGCKICDLKSPFGEKNFKLFSDLKAYLILKDGIRAKSINKYKKGKTYRPVSTKAAARRTITRMGKKDLFDLGIIDIDTLKYATLDSYSEEQLKALEDAKENYEIAVLQLEEIL